MLRDRCVHSLTGCALQPFSSAPPLASHAGGVLRLERHQVPLIEVRKAALGAEIEPVLRDHAELP